MILLVLFLGRRHLPKTGSGWWKVLGDAVPTSNAAANEKLSNRRAQTVINYLKQSGKVLPGRVLGASAMGEMHIPTNAPDTNAAYQSARRVTVRVLTSAAHLER